MVVSVELVSMDSVIGVGEELATIRAALRRACCREHLAGRRDTLVDCVLDRCLAPLVMVAGCGGFGSVGEALETVCDDLREALSTTKGGAATQ